MLSIVILTKKSSGLNSVMIKQCIMATTTESILRTQINVDRSSIEIMSQFHSVAEFNSTIINLVLNFSLIEEMLDKAQAL